MKKEEKDDILQKLESEQLDLKIIALYDEAKNWQKAQGSHRHVKNNSNQYRNIHKVVFIWSQCMVRE